jgi:phage shock protein PspC (stress-responsive transcriptional regulator)
MPLADELAKLDELYRAGALSEAEFQQAKARLLGGKPAASDVPAVAALNQLRRSRADKWLAGVCGGLAQATGLESWAWRLIFALLVLLGGTGVVVYLLLWIFVPAE